MNSCRKGIIFVISSPSGGGKTTLAECALKKIDGIERSVSMTTRPPRGGERDGRDYYFVAESKFKSLIRNKAFLEYARVFGRYYGTPKARVQKRLAQGSDLLLLIDVQGGRSVKKNVPKAVLIFLMPPSVEVLRKRLLKRSTDSEAEITKRLKLARREMAQAKIYDYILTNQSIEELAEELRSIVTAERLRNR